MAKPLECYISAYLSLIYLKYETLAKYKTPIFKEMIWAAILDFLNTYRSANCSQFPSKFST